MDPHKYATTSDEFESVASGFPVSQKAIGLHTFPVEGDATLPIADTFSDDNISVTGLRLNNIQSWNLLRKHPYGFTNDSVCASGRAAGALWWACRPGAKGDTTVVQVQLSSDVVIVDVQDSKPDSSSGAASAYVPLKRTVGPCRLLVLLPAGAVVRSQAAPSKDVGAGQLLCACQEDDFISLAAARSLGISARPSGPSVEDCLAKAGCPAQDLSRTDSRFAGLLAWLKKSTRTWAKAAGKTEGAFILTISDSDVTLTQEQPADRAEPSRIVQPEQVRSLLMAAGPAPQAAPTAGVKRPRPDDGDAAAGPVRPPQPAVPSSSAPAAAARDGVHLAVIVPFRDQPEQNRAEQLRRFIAHMPSFLASPSVSPPLASYHIIVVEQSADGFKFNRGKLLNLGFAIANDPDRQRRYGLPGGVKYDAYCFHDVDLLPGPAIGPWYSKRPSPLPVHIGSAWSRYPYENYVGGILTLDRQAVLATNGFPNDFWGWGGEDDELYSRLREARLLPVAKPPPAVTGCLVDLEEVLIQERGGMRAGTGLKDGGKSEWRNMWKREGIARHEATWRSNGVNSLAGAFAVRRVTQHAPHVTIVTVDLQGEKDPHAQKQEAMTPIPEAGRPGAGARM